ncbi:MAG: DUF302 domain-containing protein [Candidatus Heimdallarchaeota archaeon]|nr:DUF302 domain-containing protein [Candidatus Heimdallarchaeota archaeon]
MVNILKKELSMTFNEAVSHVEKIIVEEGFSLIASKALDEIFKTKLNIENYPRYTMILACNPKLAKMALDASFNVGLLFPCSFVVYEQEGKIIVSHASIMTIAKEVDLVDEEAMNPVIEVTKKIVLNAWDRF